jgi:hypothetical protein
MKNNKPGPPLKCGICGKFMAWRIIGTPETCFMHTPDTHFGPEKEEHFHYLCVRPKLKLNRTDGVYLTKEEKEHDRIQDEEEEKIASNQGGKDIG